MLASVKSLICPSVEPRLCITPLGKGMKASPCHSVVSPRLMGVVARDLHIVGGLSVCRLYYEKMCVYVYVIHLYTFCMCVCVCIFEPGNEITSFFTLTPLECLTVKFLCVSVFVYVQM